jgi:hypothetical protein
VDEKDNVVASDQFFPGKEKPWKFDSDNKGLALFFDGIQAEMNVPASTCRESLSYYIRTCLRKANDKIGKKHSIVMQPSIRVKQSVLNNADPEARIFGCAPDFNAYTLGQNTPEMDASRHPYRYAGGHIHLGISSPYLRKDSIQYQLAKTEEGHIKTIKFIDYLTGAILVMMDKGVHAKRRRTKYGTAGCFRPTPYGLEYRTPSCWWMKSPATMSLTFGILRLAWNILVSKADEDLIAQVGYSQEDVRGIVDESDTVAAKKFWKSLRPYLAVTSESRHNPLHLVSLRTSQNSYVGKFMYDNYQRKNIENNEFPYKSKGTQVYALAAFEYMVRHGSDVIITDDVAKEWQFNSENAFYNVNGFIDGSFAKLFRNEDFLNFQKDFFAKVI